MIYVVPLKDLRKKRKIWRLLKSLCGTRDAGQVFATYMEERPQRSWFSEKCAGAMFVLGRNAGTTWCALRRPFHLWHADGLQQLMREVFKVKICERIGPGFLTSVEFLHKKVGWNAEGSSWTHDPEYTLAMADGFVSTVRSKSTKRS